ncbi:MAG: class I SAM-dependent methyltransferase [Acidimicrobiia bacterium]
MATRWGSDARPNSAEYDARWQAMAEAGEDPHGEASFVASLGPHSVLDAGCGTGRVAIELARRGIEAWGVDLDGGFVDRAREKAPDLTWHHADLASVDLGRRFDAVVAAGNVMIFLTPGTEGAVLANFARHLEPGGHVVTGFQVLPGRLALSEFDRLAADAGLTIADRFATWSADPFGGGDYAVSVLVTTNLT